MKKLIISIKVVLFFLLVSYTSCSNDFNKDLMNNPSKNVIKDDDPLIFPCEDILPYWCEYPEALCTYPRGCKGNTIYNLRGSIRVYGWITGGICQGQYFECETTCYNMGPTQSIRFPNSGTFTVDYKTESGSGAIQIVIPPPPGQNYTVYLCSQAYLCRE